MTPIKTITATITQAHKRTKSYVRVMILPIGVYFLLAEVTSLKNHYIFLISLMTYIILRIFIVWFDKHTSLDDILAYNKQRDEENHEFTKLMIDGKLYVDNRIMDIVKEMGLIMSEENKGKD